MKLHELKPNVPRKAPKRKGQGIGTGNGTFAGRGCKGQNARSGGGVRIGFEGGQTPLIQRMPKKGGFRNPNRVEAKTLNLADIENHFEAGETISYETLLAKKLIHRNDGKVKILGDGECSKKVSIDQGILVSASAKTALEKTGSTFA